MAQYKVGWKHISGKISGKANLEVFDIKLDGLSKKAHEVAKEKYRLLDELKALKASLKGRRNEERKALKVKIDELDKKIQKIEEKPGDIEAEIDRQVAELYGISREELEEIKRLYGVLIG